MRVTIAITPAARRVDQRVVDLPDDACLRDALDAVAIDPVALGMSVGVWGRARPLDWRLVDGDRIELCRALEIDPMQARRRRHEHQQRWKAAKAAGR